MHDAIVLYLQPLCVHWRSLLVGQLSGLLTCGKTCFNNY